MSTLTTPSLFTVAEMTEAINKLPLMPLRLAPLFTARPVRTVSVALDIKKGRITLVPHQDRSAPPQSLAGRGDKRSVKVLQTAHLPQADTATPEDVQDVRAFGSTEPITAATVINDKLLTIKNNIEMTLELHRLGAVKGVVMDADGTTVLHNLYEVFECTKQVQDVLFPSGETVKDNPILTAITKAKRKLEAGMGGVPFQRIECLVGADFYDALTGHKLVRDLFQGWLERQSQFGDNDFRRRGFLYGGVMFYEASEVVGGRTLVDATKGHMYPVGTGLYSCYNAPANWMETANTYGLPMYARIDPLQSGRGHQIEGQANPLTLCNFPEALVELTAK